MSASEDIILNISTELGDALTNIRNYQDANNDLRKTIAETKASIEEQEKAIESNGETELANMDSVNKLRDRLVLLTAEQKSNTQAINANKKVAEEAIEQSKGQLDSINEMRKTSAKLTAQWQAMSKAERESAKGKELQAKLDETNKAINSAMLSVSSFKDNVGNYRSAISGYLDSNTGVGGVLKTLGVNLDDVANKTGSATDGFKSLGKNVISQVGAMGKALLSLAANPIFLTIAGVTAIVMGIVDAIKRSESATNAIRQALSALNPIIDLVQNAFSTLANYAVKYIEGIVSVVNKLVDISASAADAVAGFFGRETQFRANVEESRKMASDLMRSEQELTERKRKFLVSEAETEKEIAELRASIADKDAYTQAERLAMLDKAIAKEKKIAEEKLTIAKQEYDNLVKEGERAENDAEANEQLAQARANLAKAETEHFKTMRKLQTERNGLIKEGEAEEKAQQKARADRAKAQRAEEERLAKEEAARLAEVAKAAAEAAKEAEKLAQKTAEANAKVAKETASLTLKTKEAQLKALDDVQNARLQLLQDSASAELTQLQEVEAEKNRIAEEAKQVRIERIKAEYEERKQATEGNELLDEETRQSNLLALNAQYLTDLASLEADYNKAKQDNALRTAQIIESIDKKSAEKRQAIQQSTINATKSALGGVSAILETFSKSNRKAFEANKKVQIATTIIETIESAQKSFNAFASIPFVGPALGATAAASALASGYARVRQIQSTSFDSAGASQSASTSVSASTYSSSSSAGSQSVVNATDYAMQSDRGVTSTIYDAPTNAIDTISRADMVEAIKAQPAPVVHVADVNEVQGAVEARRESSII